MNKEGHKLFLKVHIGRCSSCICCPDALAWLQNDFPQLHLKPNTPSISISCKHLICGLCTYLILPSFFSDVGDHLAWPWVAVIKKILLYRLTADLPIYDHSSRMIIRLVTSVQSLPPNVYCVISFTILSCTEGHVRKLSALLRPFIMDIVAHLHLMHCIQLNIQ